MNKKKILSEIKKGNLFLKDADDKLKADEEVVLELRLNLLDKYVDYFVIVESNFTHRGEKRSLLFNHKKFGDFIGF